MFLYGCADNLKDTSQYSSVDNSNNSTDTGTGDNQGSGDNAGIYSRSFIFIFLLYMRYKEELCLLMQILQ